MKKQRKIVFWAASLLLTGALAAGGTLAYLTDKDSVTNQFVVGKVDIEGNEPSYARIRMERPIILCRLR